MLALVVASLLHALPPPDYTKDLDSLLSDLESYGAYVEDDKIDFAALDKAYRPRFEAAKTNGGLVPVLEALVGELHDFHASLGTNNAASPRLVPSGTDLHGEWKGERAFVEQIRAGSLAEEAGIQPGDEVVRVGDLSVRGAAKGWFGTLSPDRRGWEWALDSALAGRWNVSRRLLLRRKGQDREMTLSTARRGASETRLTILRPGNGLVVLRPEDSLGQTDLLKDLDRAMAELRTARGIVLDLRNTPSGGNTTVARGILGLFIDKRMPYQRHLVEERETGTVRDWVEYATPRLAKPIRTRLMVLVGRWTGSMGEGLAIGFDAMKRADVIGTRMAGLRGAVDSTTLPVSGIRVYFPTERLFHVSGTPRHDWVPPLRVVPGPGDPWMSEARKRLTI